MQKISTATVPVAYHDYLYRFLKKTAKTFLYDFKQFETVTGDLVPCYQNISLKEMPDVDQKKGVFLYMLPTKKELPDLMKILEDLDDYSFIIIGFKQFNNEYDDDFYPLFSKLENDFVLLEKEEILIRHNVVDHGSLNFDHCFFALRKWINYETERKQDKGTILGTLADDFNTKLESFRVQKGEIDNFFYQGYIDIDGHIVFYTKDKDRGFIINKVLNKEEKPRNIKKGTPIFRYRKPKHRRKMPCLVGSVTKKV